VDVGLEVREVVVGSLGAGGERGDALGIVGELAVEIGEEFVRVGEERGQLAQDARHRLVTNRLVEVGLVGHSRHVPKLHMGFRPLHHALVQHHGGLFC
jgi:hypothetical protein